MEEETEPIGKGYQRKDQGKQEESEHEREQRLQALRNELAMKAMDVAGKVITSFIELVANKGIHISLIIEPTQPKKEQRE